MGRIGTVSAWIRKALTGEVRNDPGGGAVLQSSRFTAPGVDSVPLPGDYVLTVEVQGTGSTAAVGVVDGQNASTANPGELRIYARDADGALVVSLYLRNDGSAVLTNGSGMATLQPSGEFNINGARITTDGDVISATGVSLNNHTHSQGQDSGGDTEQPTSAPIVSG